jgi:hypothetical protein
VLVANSLEKRLNIAVDPVVAANRNSNATAAAVSSMVPGRLPPSSFVDLPVI